MDTPEIYARIDRMYDDYWLQAKGQGREPVSREEWTQEFRMRLIERLLKGE